MKVNFMKQKMELIWHSCTDCLPNEDFNSRLYVTDGSDVFPVSWARENHLQRFTHGGWYIEPGVNSEGYWWADILQTVQGVAALRERSG